VAVAVVMLLLLLLLLLMFPPGRTRLSPTNSRVGARALPPC
jgi:hypothetical protein